MSLLCYQTILNGTLYEPFYKKETIIPDGTVRTESGAFKDKCSIETVFCPSTFEEVSGMCFSGCYDIKHITLSDKIKSIYAYAFDCFDKSFIHTKFKVIALTESITQISDSAFGESINANTLFLVPKGSYAERYVKKTKRRYKIYDTSVSFLSTENVHNGVLYSINKSQKKQKIIDGVKSIASFAFEDYCNLESITFPNSLEKIEDYAFKGCSKLKEIVFNANLKEIGSKAFYDADLKYIELPDSVKKLASDAFNTEKCMISIGGNMPDHAKKSKEIESLKLALDSDKKDLEQIKKLISLDKEDISNTQAAIDLLKHDITNEQRSLDSLLSDETDLTENLKNTILEYNSKKSSIDSKIVDLESLRKHTFFLALSKKKRYETEIAVEKENQEIAMNEINSIQEDFNIKYDDLEQKKKSITQKIAKTKALVDVLEGENSGLRDNVAELVEKENNLTRKIADSEMEYNAMKQSLDTLNTQWLEKFNDVKVRVAEEEKAAGERIAEEKHLKKEQKRIAELNEKKSALISKLSLPLEKGSNHIHEFNSLLEEEKLLCNEYNLANDSKIKHDYIKKVNDYIASNEDKLEEIYDINNQLGIEKDNGVEQFFKQEVPDIRNPILPERILRLSNAFKDNPYWQNFKKAMNACIKLNKTNSDFFGKVFSDIDSLRYDDKYFLKDFKTVFEYSAHKTLFDAVIFLPYFILFSGQKNDGNRPFFVSTYDGTISSADGVAKSHNSGLYAEVEEYFSLTKYDWAYSDLSVFGEVIDQHYRFAKNNGEPDLRYSYNPIDKKIRYTRVIIRDKNMIYASFPAKTLELAEKVCEAFNEFTNYILNGLRKEIYDAVVNSEDTESIELKLANAIKAEKKLAKQKAQAEEEEKKRIREERLAAEREAKLEAERKKQELIERQRKINEERKREAEKKKEKQREIAKLFNDDYTNDNNDSVQDNSVDVSDESSLPVEIMDKHMISNTVFKVNLSLRADCSNGPITAYFVDCENKLISNRKKLSADDGENIQLGFVFVSGIDYSAMSKCYLEFETPTEKLGKIAFDVNISFSPDEF